MTKIKTNKIGRKNKNKNKNSRRNRNKNGSNGANNGPKGGRKNRGATASAASRRRFLRKLERRMQKKIQRNHAEATTEVIPLRPPIEPYESAPNGLKSNAFNANASVPASLQAGMAPMEAGQYVLNNTLSYKNTMTPLPSRSSDEVMNTFITALLEPGLVDTPFIDSDTITPTPHGILHSNPVYPSVSNTRYMIALVSPSAASSVSDSLAAQRPGWGWNQGPSGYSITPDDIMGVPGNWVNIWGNTTACSRLYTFAMRLQIVLNAPGAVVQGNFYYGNAPYGLVANNTIANLIMMSTEMKAEKAGETYEIRASIVERNLVHLPYDTYDTTNFPNDERVSWIIFCPNSVGSIAGAAPGTVNFTIVAHCNYLWVPVFQPEVVGTTEASIMKDRGTNLGPGPKSVGGEATAGSAVMAVPPTWLDRVRGVIGGARDLIAPYVNGTNLLRLGTLALSAVAYWSRLRGYANNSKGFSNGAGGSSSARVHDPLNVSDPYLTIRADVEWYMMNANSRWGDWSKYPTEIAEAIEDWFETSQVLVDSLAGCSKLIEDMRQDFEDGTRCIRFERGREIIHRESKSGVSIDDWKQKISAYQMEIREEIEEDEDDDDENEMEEGVVTESNPKTTERKPVAKPLDPIRLARSTKDSEGFDGQVEDRKGLSFTSCYVVDELKDAQAPKKIKK